MDRTLFRFASLPLAAALTVAALSATAKADINRPPRAAATNNPGRVTAPLCLAGSSRSTLDINNVRAMVLNGGDMWWDLNNAQYEVPKVTVSNEPRRHSIFAGSLWIGGVDDNETLYTAAQTYRQGSPPDAGFWPGPLDDQGTIDRDICSAWNTHSKIDKSIVDRFRQSGPPSDPNSLPREIREWPAKNNPYINRPRLGNELAPFVDVDGDLSYDPMKGDYPQILGDQAIWWVLNDVGNVKEPFSPAIGLEIDVLAFAFKTSNLLNSATFYKQKVINKSQKTLRRTYIGQWVDPDVGYFNDDFVACDVGRGLGICYNGDDLDEGVSGYGINPPAVGVDFFEGPVADANDGIDNDRDSYATGRFNPAMVDEPGEKIIMSNFVYYNNDFSINGNPTAAAHFYNYLRSKITTGQDLRFGSDGVNNTSTTRTEPYAFMFPYGACGDDRYGFGFNNPPVPGVVPPFEWSEDNRDGFNQRNVPADRRFLQSAGPFTLGPGAINNVTIGVVWARAGSGGARGSINLLCQADDKAQQLFDNNFEEITGPPAPIVTATELDQQIVLAIQPGNGFIGNQPTNTEDFQLSVPGVLGGAPDRTYKFEGYLVYETIRASIEASELDNPDKARLIARGDLVNGVTSIINQEYDADLGSFVPRLRVNADNADQGIFHTLNITTTQFPTGADSRLKNSKRYFFKVLPYAYAPDAGDGPPREIERFLPGDLAEAIAIPAQLQVAGTAFAPVAVTRVLGEGAGNRILNIKDADEQEILRNNEKLLLNYAEGSAPLNIRIYDPTAVKNERFVVKFSSRLAYRTRTLTGRAPQEGDIIVSTGQYVRGETGRAAIPADTAAGTPAVGRQTVRIDNGGSPQIPGRARVVRVVNTIESDSSYQYNTGRIDTAGNPIFRDTIVSDPRVELELEMLNDHLGGTFTAEVGRYQFNGSDSTLLGYETETRSFEIEGGAGTATAYAFNLHDYWKWRTQGATTWNNVERRVSEVNEELIPDYGLSIRVSPGRNPGFRNRDNAQAQFLEATLTHSGAQWLTGVGNAETALSGGVAWLAPTSPTSPTRTFDYTNVYSRILQPDGQGGTWAAYTNTAPVNSNGAQYVVAPTRRLYNLRNVDVVLTSDKSKWTRVNVLQITSQNPAFSLTKRFSTKPSVGRDGQPDGSVTLTGQPSTGMGWFPGYAIDLDRGIRLNMMFAESTAPPNAATPGQGTVEGSDLIWQPNSTRFAGRNFIYVTDTKYDEGKEMERQQDEAAVLLAGQARARYAAMYEQIMWVGYPRLRDNTSLLQSDVRVRLRVNRAFTSYPAPDPQTGLNTNPEYGFEVKAPAPLASTQDEACKQLEARVRVVPNPYYAFSQYEGTQIGNIAKVSNLPRRATVTIYTLNGTLVRRLRKDNSDRFLDFDMQNDSNLPIASGVYLFHVKDDSNGCEAIVKWFCVVRPVDLESF